VLGALRLAELAGGASQSGRSLRENRCSFAPLSRTRSTTPPAASRSILYALRASRCAREGLGFFGAIAERYTSIGPREIVTGIALRQCHDGEALALGWLS